MKSLICDIKEIQPYPRIHGIIDEISVGENKNE